MKTENEIIAEFMGGERYGSEECIMWRFDEMEFMDDDLSYHTSWDWLMPVVEKIDSLYNEASANEPAITNRPGFYLYMNVIAAPMSTPIDVLYKSVVMFINWYNEKAKNKPS